MDTTKAYIVWHFDDAPLELQLLSGNGGDEDWLVLFPPGVDETSDWQSDAWIMRIGISSVQYCTAPDGRRVAIGSHC